MATFLNYLVLAFCIWGVSSLRDCAVSVPTPGAVKPFFVGLLFILIALLIVIVPVHIPR